MEWYEVAFDRMYPVVYKRRDLDEAVGVMETFEEVFRNREPILDLACGAGRYLEALSMLGYNVFGLDLSHYLLKACVDKWGHADEIIQGDMRLLPFLDGSVGSVINMFTSFGYFSQDTDNLLVFREVHRILRADGVFLFDYINSKRMTDELLENTERAEDNYHIKEKRRIDKYGKYLVKEIEIKNLLSGEKTAILERLRLYTKEDLLSMFSSIGFEVKDIFGDYAGRPFLEGVSERVVILAEKKQRTA